MRVARTYFVLRVTDMDRAVAFWKDVFGMATRFESPDLSELVLGDLTFQLRRGGSTPPGGAFGFEVDGIEDACGLVAGHGGRIVNRPQQRRAEPVLLAEVADPDGNRFGLAQPLD